MISFPQPEVVACCRQFGPQLLVPESVNGFTVMLSIAAVESGGADIRFAGHNCGPRQEPAYSDGGSLARGTQADLNRTYGDTIAGASHGPWQMMFINFTPEVQRYIAGATVTLLDYAREFVRHFNSYVIRAKHAQTVDEIGEVWNLGHIGPDPAYVAKLTKAYSQAETESL